MKTKMKTTNKIIAGFAMLAVMAVGAGFAVNIEGAIVNAATGFQFNGAAPSGHVLCGNGSEYVDAATCGAAANYQTMQNNGTPFTPRADLNFSSRFFLTDTPPSTTVDLQSVTSAATYINPTQIVVDVFGRVTSAISGGTFTQTDVTASRTFGGTFQNTNSTPLYVGGFGTLSGGSGDSTITCLDGPSAATTVIGATATTATITGEKVNIPCGVPIPPSYFYSVTVTNIISSTPGSWIESH